MLATAVCVDVKVWLLTNQGRLMHRYTRVKLVTSTFGTYNVRRTDSHACTLNQIHTLRVMSLKKYII